MTPHLEDFTGEVSEVKREISSLSCTTQVEGEGNVSCIFCDEHEVTKHVKTKAHYMSSRIVRLFSSRNCCKKEKNDSFSVDNKGCVLEFASVKTLTFEHAER